MNDHGELHPTMPQGPEYNDYKMALHARIIDTLGGAAVYNICDIRVGKVFITSRLLQIKSFKIKFHIYKRENNS